MVDEERFDKVKALAKALNVKVIPTSLEMEENRWIEDVF